MNPAIETENLVKTFRNVRAVDGVDLRVRRGTVFGLLGPNGAGKTTTIRVLATLLRPTEGTARVLGHDVVHEGRQVREKVALTGQFASVDDELTGLENLILVGRLAGFSWADARSRGRELLDAFGLADAAKRLVRGYSGGMRRRLDIAASLVTTPEVLFLDEPTSGLDPRSRNQVWDVVRAITRQGTTVLLTTQYLDEADRLADRLAVVDRGRVIAEGTSADLKASVGATSVHVRLADATQRPKAETAMRRVLKGEIVAGQDAARFSAQVTDQAQAAAALRALSTAKVRVAEFSLGSPSLDDVFFALTGHAADAPTQEATA